MCPYGQCTPLSPIERFNCKHIWWRSMTRKNVIRCILNNRTVHMSIYTCPKMSSFTSAHYWCQSSISQFTIHCCFISERYLVWSETFGNVSSISAIEVRETGWHFQNNLATRYVYSPKFSENVTSSITSLGYLHSQDLVFFSDAGTRCIYKLHIDMLSNDLNSPGNTSSDSRAQNNSSQPEVIHCGTSGVIDGIAVDWLSGAVYWTDRAYRTISVVSHRTLMSRTLIKDELEKPGGIAVDPING